MNLKELVKILNDEIKLKEQDSWDNSGLQIGDFQNEISNILLCLDLDLNTVQFCVKNNINLILTHHPFLFKGIKSIDYSSYEGKIVLELIKNNINLYSMHTNFDMAEKGVSYSFAEKLGIKNYEILHMVTNDYGYGGIGYIKPIELEKFSKNVKEILSCDFIKLYGNENEIKSKIIEKVAFCGGSGSDFIEDAIFKNADIYITGDIKYHEAQYAINNNLYIIDAGHYNTEKHCLEIIEKILSKIQGINIVRQDRNTVYETVIY